jgi:hypothetical protein
MGVPFMGVPRRPVVSLRKWSVTNGTARKYECDLLLFGGASKGLFTRQTIFAPYDTFQCRTTPSDTQKDQSL